MVIKINNLKGGRQIEFSPSGEINYIEIIHRAENETNFDYKKRVSDFAIKTKQGFTTIKYLGSSKEYYRAIIIVWRWEGMADIWEKSLDYKDIEWKAKNIPGINIVERKSPPKNLDRSDLSIRIKTNIGDTIDVSKEGEIRNVEIIDATQKEGWMPFNERFLKQAKEVIGKTVKPQYVTFRRIPNFRRYKGIIVTWANAAVAGQYYKKLDYRDLVKKIENPLELMEL